MSYSPTLGRWMEQDPAGYVEGSSLYQYERSDPINLLDPAGLDAAPDQAKWDKQKKPAEDALNFWKDFLNLRMGNNPNGGPITDDCMKKMLDMIRAISWVESQHGTAGQNQPGRDPMQSGNPRDKWWQAVQGQGGDRIIGGPGKENWNVGDLPGATRHPAPPKGHDDPNFTPDMSYFWGVLGFIHKTNTGPKGGGRTYRCGDCSWDQLIDGAIKYNGGGDPNYGQKIKDALKMIGSGPQ
ncbi:MAG: hypothetical protein JWQ42_4717 [Edaphobacter sp.]|nr:hypothetical protein [Edaphobacter sp.]